MKSHFRFTAFVALVTVLLLLAACGPGPQAMTDANPGVARDTIFSVEPRQNGTFTVWLTHDDVGAYCSRDTRLLALAQEIVNDQTRTPEVIITYRSINLNEAESGGILGLQYLTSACGAERGTDGTIRYLLLTIRRDGDPEPQ